MINMWSFGRRMGVSLHVAHVEGYEHAAHAAHIGAFACLHLERMFATAWLF